MPGKNRSADTSSWKKIEQRFCATREARWQAWEWRQRAETGEEKRFKHGEVGENSNFEMVADCRASCSPAPFLYREHSGRELNE